VDCSVSAVKCRFRGFCRNKHNWQVPLAIQAGYVNRRVAQHHHHRSQEVNQQWWKQLSKNITQKVPSYITEKEKKLETDTHTDLFKLCQEVCRDQSKRTSETEKRPKLMTAKFSKEKDHHITGQNEFGGRERGTGKNVPSHISQNTRWKSAENYRRMDSPRLHHTKWPMDCIQHPGWWRKKTIKVTTQQHLLTKWQVRTPAPHSGNMCTHQCNK